VFYKLWSAPLNGENTIISVENIKRHIIVLEKEVFHVQWHLKWYNA
jgi:hypothetical protein